MKSIQNFIWVNRDGTNEKPFVNIGVNHILTKEEKIILDKFLEDFNKLVDNVEKELIAAVPKI